MNLLKMVIVKGKRKKKPESGGTPISAPMRERAFRIWLLGSFPLSSSSKSVKRFSANIAKSSSSSKISFNVLPSRIETTTGVSVRKKINSTIKIEITTRTSIIKKYHSTIRTETEHLIQSIYKQNLFSFFLNYFFLND